MPEIPRSVGAASANHSRNRGAHASARYTTFPAHTLFVGLHRQAGWYVNIAHICGGRALTVADGSAFLIFQTPQLPFPIDGLIYQDREQRYSIPAGSSRVSLYDASGTFPLLEYSCAPRNSK